jgi:predicted metal-dependent peptidase
MKFSKVIGNIDPTIIIKAEAHMERLFLEFGMKPDKRDIGSKLGGSPLLFALLVPTEHIATANIPTAATTGTKFYWNPHYILSKSILGLRLIAAHESWHSLYLHPDRRGSRNLKIWNIAVDYIVNKTVMDDLKLLRYDPSTIFRKELGEFLTLQQLEDWCKNPNWLLNAQSETIPSLTLPKLDEERELTDQEKKALDQHQKTIKFFFADPDLPEQFQTAEKLYQHLFDLFKQYPQAGKMVMGNADTIDYHVDAEETQQEAAKRVAKAIEMAKRMAGTVPKALEQELGALLQPKIKWQDIIRHQMIRTKDGNTKNDWTRFRSRALFAGLLIPKRINLQSRFAVLLDTSASMRMEEKILGVSQLQALDERAEGVLVCADSQVYWDKAIALKRFDRASLSSLKYIGGGGTKLHDFINNYKKHLNEVDFLIVITDGALDLNDIKQMKQPALPVYWLLVANEKFSPPFGKTLQLTE